MCAYWLVWEIIAGAETGVTGDGLFPKPSQELHKLQLVTVLVWKHEGKFPHPDLAAETVT